MLDLLRQLAEDALLLPARLGLLAAGAGSLCGCAAFVVAFVAVFRGGW